MQDFECPVAMWPVTSDTSCISWRSVICVATHVAFCTFLCDFLLRILRPYVLLVSWYPLPAKFTTPYVPHNNTAEIRPSKLQISGFLKILKDQLDTAWTARVSNPSMSKVFCSPKPSLNVSRAHEACNLQCEPVFLPPGGKAAGAWTWPFTSI